uniref:Uncharacterized protein n=1 Tax=Alexandrium monilatum TaxID=311494 RepID=A0A7S4TB36_9DINO
MWTPHHAGAGAGPEMAAAWSAGADVVAVDYGSPVAGTPMPSAPVGGLMEFFPGAPLAASILPLADIVAHACNQAPELEAQVQTISSRVQKLERSRGQISKDIADMLSETRDLQRKAGLVEARRQASPTAAKALEAPAVIEEPAEGPPGPGAARRPSRLKTASPSSLPRVPEEQLVSGKSQTDKIPPPPGLGLPLPESLVALPKEADGREITRVEWRIDNVKAKFRDCGHQRPLVSPQFEAGGLSELRLMVFPNLGLGVSGLTMREQKSRYEARIAEGPLSGALKFKVVTSCSDRLVIAFNLFVGGMVQGPIEHNFAEHIIHGLDFKDNWIDQMKNGSLVVGVEVLTVHGPGAKQGGSLES